MPLQPLLTGASIEGRSESALASWEAPPVVKTTLAVVTVGGLVLGALVLFCRGIKRRTPSRAIKPRSAKPAGERARPRLIDTACDHIAAGMVAPASRKKKREKKKRCAASFEEDEPLAHGEATAGPEELNGTPTEAGGRGSTPSESISQTELRKELDAELEAIIRKYASTPRSILSSAAVSTGLGRGDYAAVAIGVEDE